jgi:predicted neutral ceramidase superfamily lipid hydrolase
MGDAGEMPHDENGEMIHDEMIHDYAAAEMVAAADSDRHDSYGDGEMATVCSDDGDGDATVLFDSNNIESNCMDSHIYSKPHHD